MSASLFVIPDGTEHGGPEKGSVRCGAACRWTASLINTIALSDDVAPSRPEVQITVRENPMLRSTTRTMIGPPFTCPDCGTTLTNFVQLPEKHMPYFDAHPHRA